MCSSHLTDIAHLVSDASRGYHGPVLELNRQEELEITVIESSRRDGPAPTARLNETNDLSRCISAVYATPVHSMILT